jgi:hypothetical protein
MRRRIVLRVVLLALALAVAAPIPAMAEGPGTGGRAIRLENEPAGPYLLRVVTSPTPPRVGSLFLEVRVLSARSEEILTDVEVTTTAIPTEVDEPAIEAIGTHDFAPNPVEYAAHLPVTSAGVWEVRVHVRGELGEGEVSFLQRVSSQATLGAALSLALPAAGIGGLILVFLLLQRRQPPVESEQRPN